MIVYTANGHISGLVLIGNHVHFTQRRFLFAGPVNVLPVGTRAVKAMTLIDQHITTGCALITHTVPIIQSTSKICFHGQANTYFLRSNASGLGQEALVTIVTKIVGIQFSQCSSNTVVGN